MIFYVLMSVRLKLTFAQKGKNISWDYYVEEKNNHNADDVLVLMIMVMILVMTI